MTKDLIAKNKKTIANFFDDPRVGKHLGALLPKIGITPERMIKLLFSAITQVPRLAECTPASLFNAIAQTASLGLEPNTPLGHAYLIPFRDNDKKITRVQVIIGYKGYLSLCRRSGELQNIAAHVVYNDDFFEFQLGTEPFLKHVPSFTGSRLKKDIKCAYCVARLKDGGVAFEVMPIAEIDLLQARSKSPHFGPWATDYPQMVRKSTIRRLMNYLPMSIEMARAQNIDIRSETGVSLVPDFLDIDLLPEEEEGKDENTLAAKASKAAASKKGASEKEKPPDKKPSGPLSALQQTLKGTDQKLIKKAAGNLHAAGKIEDHVLTAILEENWEGVFNKECELLLDEARKIFDYSYISPS